MSAGKNGGNYISGSDMLTNNVDLVDQISVILIFIKFLKVTLNKNKTMGFVSEGFHLLF